MKSFAFFLPILLILSFLTSCQKTDTSKTFTKLSPSQTGIRFTNQLSLNENFDVFRYRNYYNGGGVAIGDINNDSLPDIYLTGNTQKNKLYLNLGDLKFKDISADAGVEGNKAWSTGVSMADVNGDGLLDIYVCNSGNIEGDNKENELFINNGDLTFSEKAKEYGLADQGFSTHAAFFDYDLDGDLDCYLLNNSFKAVGSFGFENVRNERDPLGGDKLLRNDGNTFVDVSEEARIFGSAVGFGLGIALGDVNLDGWPDIYVSNDFFERDYLYINQQDGTYRDELTDYIRHTSEFSMGSDIGDLNNDGFPEIFVTDMLPESDYRLKTTQSFMDYDQEQKRLQNDYYHQHMHNSLQLNNGNNTFSEIAHYAEVSRTDWSWGALIADFDNQGDKEIFVTNGIYKDVTDQDFINFLANDERMEKVFYGEKVDFKEFNERMPSNPLNNYLFKKNPGVLKYDNLAEAWGLAEPSFSNGAAYGDLDNDGDLDLVVNNVNQELFFYRNNTELSDSSHFLKVSFLGKEANRFGVGARLELYHAQGMVLYENYPTRGFQSSMDYTATLGVGKAAQLDSIVVKWPGKLQQTLKNVATDTWISLDIKNASLFKNTSSITRPKMTDIALEPSFVHKENRFVDFDRERLMYHMVSRSGPALATGDLNGDGLDDFFIGGAANQDGRIYLQTGAGFTQLESLAIKNDSLQEDVDAILIDIDGDKDLDLYVVSGGNAFQNRHPLYQDRLYENIGTPNAPKFSKEPSALPKLSISGSCVRPADFDSDGDLDLFVGGRVIPGKYGLPTDSYLLENQGDGTYKDITSEKIPQLKAVGMVTDAAWVDYDGDELLDLILVGDWMPITLFNNKEVGFTRIREPKSFLNTEGLWNAIQVGDLNADGKVDLILGNLGLNSRFRASVEKPFELFIYDFDGNGSLEHIYAHHPEDKLVPFALKQDLSKQLVSLKKKYTYFTDFANKSMDEIFGDDTLALAVHQKAYTFASQVAMNQGNGNFKLGKMPEKAQFSTIHSIIPLDFQGDGQMEFLCAGNFSATKPELGNYDANYGYILETKKDGSFGLVSAEQNKILVTGDVRRAGILNSKNGSKLIVFARNNDKPLFYKFTPEPK